MQGERRDVARLETFSDGVFAIAATLLILNVSGQGGEFGGGRAWLAYAAYAVTFVNMGIIWVNHHTAFSQIGRADRTFLMLNVFFLMFVAFIPYPTGLLTEHLGGAGAARAAVLYGATLTATAVCTNLWWLYASRRRRLLRHDASPRLVAGITRSYLVGPVVYLTATLVAIIAPTVAAVLYAAIAVFYVLESSLFAGQRADGA
jgi:uncharacterized membrane protein